MKKNPSHVPIAPLPPFLPSSLLLPTPTISRSTQTDEDNDMIKYLKLRGIETIEQLQAICENKHVTKGQDDEEVIFVNEEPPAECEDDEKKVISNEQLKTLIAASVENKRIISIVTKKDCCSSILQQTALWQKSVSKLMIDVNKNESNDHAQEVVSAMAENNNKQFNNIKPNQEQPTVYGQNLCVPVIHYASDTGVTPYNTETMSSPPARQRGGRGRNKFRRQHHMTYTHRDPVMMAQTQHSEHHFREMWHQQSRGYSVYNQNNNDMFFNQNTGIVPNAYDSGMGPNLHHAGPFLGPNGHNMPNNPIHTPIHDRMNNFPMNNPIHSNNPINIPTIPITQHLSPSNISNTISQPQQQYQHWSPNSFNPKPQWL